MPVLSHDINEEIAWSLDGKPVNLEWDSCSMVAPGGYDSFRGKVTGHLQQRRLHQGVTVRGVRPNGRVLYQGLVSSPPKIVNEVATIEAEGFAGILRRRTKRLPYVIADASQWSQTGETPFNYPANDGFSLQSKGNGLGWMISTDAFSANDRAGYALYIPEFPVQRLRATIRKNGSNANFDFEVRDADDLGAASVVDTKNLSTTADGTSWNVNAVNQNTVIINVICNTGSTPANPRRFWLQDVQACVLADDNDWTTSQVAADVASRAGFASNVKDTAQEIGSLDWTGSWDELLNYLAAISDWTWLVEEDRTKGTKADAMLSFQPWGRRTWVTNLNASQESLTVAPLYNRVTVHYERPAGVPQHKSFDTDDFSDIANPATDGRTYEYPETVMLEDPQRTTNLVEAIGEALLRRVSQVRLVGDIKVGGLERGVPFDIKAGDYLDVRGFTPDAPPQRIATVRYNADGTADCRLERSYDIAGMITRLSSHRRRSTPFKWGAGHRS